MNNWVEFWLAFMAVPIAAFVLAFLLGMRTARREREQQEARRAHAARYPFAKMARQRVVLRCISCGGGVEADRIVRCPGCGDGLLQEEDREPAWGEDRVDKS